MAKTPQKAKESSAFLKKSAQKILLTGGVGAGGAYNRHPRGQL